MLPYFDFIAKKYDDHLETGGSPDPLGADGSFVHWAYYHYGRWSIAARAWWTPPVKATGDATKSDDEAPAENRGDKQRDETKRGNDSTEKRGQSEINALRWLEQNDVSGFVEWTPVEHPDYPGRRVEVGGFYPYVLLNPPADLLGGLADSHLAFLTEVAQLRPRLTLREQKTEALGANIYRIAVRLINEGYLPTESQMGQRSQQLPRLELAIELPEDGRLLRGHRRVTVRPLAGRGGVP